jgi:hypothetical protein
MRIPLLARNFAYSTAEKNTTDIENAPAFSAG